MRSAQGLPVNIIVLTALGLIVLVVVAAFFITGMSGAAQQTGVVEADQAYCNGLCGQMVVAANNANDISALGFTQVAQLYQGSGCARQFGCCTVTLRTGEQVCAEGNCDEDSDCVSFCNLVTNYEPGQSVDPGCTAETFLPSGTPVLDYYLSEPNRCFPIQQECDLTPGSDTLNKCVIKDNCYLLWSNDCPSKCTSLGYGNYNGHFTFLVSGNGLCSCFP